MAVVHLRCSFRIPTLEIPLGSNFSRDSSMSSLSMTCPLVPLAGRSLPLAVYLAWRAAWIIHVGNRMGADPADSSIRKSTVPDTDQIYTVPTISIINV